MKSNGFEPNKILYEMSKKKRLLHDFSSIKILLKTKIFNCNYIIKIITCAILNKIVKNKKAGKIIFLHATGYFFFR